MAGIKQTSVLIWQGDLLHMRVVWWGCRMKTSVGAFKSHVNISKQALCRWRSVLHIALDCYLQTTMGNIDIGRKYRVPFDVGETSSVGYIGWNVPSSHLLGYSFVHGVQRYSQCFSLLWSCEARQTFVKESIDTASNVCQPTLSLQPRGACTCWCERTIAGLNWSDMKHLRAMEVARNRVREECGKISWHAMKTHGHEGEKSSCPADFVASTTKFRNNPWSDVILTYPQLGRHIVLKNPSKTG